MTKIIDIIDSTHILNKIITIPKLLIIEIMIILFSINLIFAGIYYKIYLNDKSSFKNTYNLKSNKPIEYFDFVYFSCTTFYSLGYDIVPQSKLAKIICIIELKLAFIIITIIIAKIVSVF